MKKIYLFTHLILMLSACSMEKFKDFQDLLKPSPITASYDYKITFNYDDNKIETRNVKSPAEYLTDFPPAPVKKGFTFNGWFSNVELTQAFNKETKIKGDMTIYPKWIEKKLAYSDMVFVEGMKYSQSDGYDEFNNTLSSFYIGKYEITLQLWNKILNWAVEHNYTFAHSKGYNEKSPYNELNPVTNISWYDAIVWCNAYSEYSGYETVYFINNNVTPIRDSFITDGDLYIDYSKNGFRLPTESEWQFAASSRGKTNAGNPAGNDLLNVENFSWYKENSGGHIHPVGTKKANQLGLYDMSGNIWEWCNDWYGQYPMVSKKNYTGKETGNAKIGRGGCYKSIINGLKVGYRDFATPNLANDITGFRVVRR